MSLCDGLEPSPPDQVLATLFEPDTAREVLEPEALGAGRFAVIPFALLEEIAEALEPFARAADEVGVFTIDDDQPIREPITAGQARRAREVRRMLEDELRINSRD